MKRNSLLVLGFSAVLGFGLFGVGCSDDSSSPKDGSTDTKSTGGAIATGGNKGTGGAVVTGGITGSGGAVVTGGATGSGGATGTGGTTTIVDGGKDTKMDVGTPVDTSDASDVPITPADGGIDSGIDMSITPIDSGIDTSAIDGAAIDGGVDGGID